MAFVRSFHKYRGESSFTMHKLIAILKEQIPLVVPSQIKYRVTEIPTARTIRFYTTNRIVDKPAVRDGSHVLYGYRHLLQILAVKYLQSQYLPLVKIRSLVEKADNRELELLIPALAPTTAAYHGPAVQERRIGERSILQSARIDPPPPPSEREPVDTATSAAEPHDTWHRIEVGPGIELHVHATAISGENRERLRGALLRELGVLRGWFDSE